MNGNGFMAGILRSPFHGLLSNGMMLITVAGRRTGRKYTTPVEYYHEGDYLWVMSGRERTWWRNLHGGAQVELLLKGRPVSGFAELEQDEDRVRAHLLEYLRHVPQAAWPLRIRVVAGRPDAGDVARVARDRLFIRIRL